MSFATLSLPNQISVALLIADNSDNETLISARK